MTFLITKHGSAEFQGVQEILWRGNVRILLAFTSASELWTTRCKPAILSPCGSSPHPKMDLVNCPLVVPISLH